MKIIISQNGLDVGPYTQEEAKALLAAGILDDDDQARLENGDDWLPLKDLISRHETSQLTSKDKAPSTTSTASHAETSQLTSKDKPPSAASAGSQSKPSRLTSLARARSAASAGSQSKPSQLTSKDKAPSAASAGSQSKPSRLTSSARARSAASAPGEPKVPELNRVLVICLSVAGILILIPILIMAFAPDELAKILEPGIHAGLASVYAGPTEIVDGDMITANMPTDNSGDKLRDKVLKYIYSVAKDKPFLKHLTLTVHVTGTPTQQAATIKIDDLDAVRAFSDQQAYVASDARKVIDGDLTAAGL